MPRCGASIPAWLAERFEGLEDDPETHALVASAVAAEQVLELVDEGVKEFHFYTLNRSNLVLALARLLGRRPVAEPMMNIHSEQVHLGGGNVS